MADKKKTAKRFGLKQPKKVSAKVEDLDASSKAGEVRGGLTKGVLRIDSDAHGCPACPHISGPYALGGPDTTTR